MSGNPRKASSDRKRNAEKGGGSSLYYHCSQAVPSLRLRKSYGREGTSSPYAKEGTNQQLRRPKCHGLEKEEEPRTESICGEILQYRAVLMVAKGVSTIMKQPKATTAQLWVVVDSILTLGDLRRFLKDEELNLEEARMEIGVHGEDQDRDDLEPK